MRINFNISLITVCILTAFSFSGCLKDKNKENLEAELLILKQYILDENYNVEPKPSGLYYIEQFEGTGLSPEPGNFVMLSRTGRLLEGERIFVTTSLELAEENDIVSSVFLYGPLKLQAGNLSPMGVNEGVLYMKEGGQSRMIFPSTLGFGNMPVNSIPAYSSLIYDVELIKVIPDPVEYENEMIQKYIEDNQLEVEADDQGLYYIETLEGSGEFPRTNTTAEVFYSAFLLDGRRLAATGTTPAQIYLNDYLKDYLYPYYTVKGLRDAILKMKKGGQAKVIVPYNLAFGTYLVDAVSLGYKYPLPAYSTIVYQVELVDIK